LPIKQIRNKKTQSIEFDPKSVEENEEEDERDTNERWRGQQFAKSMEERRGSEQRWRQTETKFPGIEELEGARKDEI
jgi:hypothetical protein